MRTRPTPSRTVSSVSSSVTPFPNILLEPRTATSTTTTLRSPLSRPTGISTPSAAGTSAQTSSPTLPPTPETDSAPGTGNPISPTATSTTPTPVSSTQRSGPHNQFLTAILTATDVLPSQLSRLSGSSCRARTTTMVNLRSL